LKLYRIARTAVINDLSGEGARLHGGRWNEKRVPVIYAAQSRALAALESLVHFPIVLAPRDLSICQITLPDDVPVTKLRKSALPDDWKANPPEAGTMQIGTKWALAGKTLLLIVPSVVVPDENNVLINPQHRDFRRIKKRIEPFEFDPRLLSART